MTNMKMSLAYVSPDNAIRCMCRDSCCFHCCMPGVTDGASCHRPICYLTMLYTLCAAVITILLCHKYGVSQIWCVTNVVRHRTMMMNRRRAEQLGLAALPDTTTTTTITTTTSHMSATLGSAPQGRPGTAPASRPVTGQGSWYQTGMHVLPEELNAAVLEALAAEAAGVKLQSSVAGYVLSVRVKCAAGHPLCLLCLHVCVIRTELVMNMSMHLQANLRL